MADAVEPSPKKRKFDSIFTQVLEKELKEHLRKTAICLELGFSQLLLREIKVIDANANRAVSFSRASVGMTKFEDGITYPVASIFEHGNTILKQYLQSDVSKGEIILPKDANYRKALELLLTFLDAHDRKNGAEFLICKGEVEKWQWTLELAQHVFSKLAINPMYKYDISRSYDETLGCPCSVHEALSGERGDTSFGCEKGWHGKIDILMTDLPICPVLCEPDSCGPLSSSASQTSDTDSDIDIEVKRNLFNDIMFNDNDFSQIVAKTITFSFLKNKGKSNAVTLVPSIAINNKEGFQCFFYDSANDVLLQSGYIELVTTNKVLNVNGIVLIWLTLNHQLFCTGTLQTMKSSGFQKLVDLPMYKEEVCAPCRISQDHDEMCISDTKWSNYTDSMRKYSPVSAPPCTMNCITDV